MNLSTAFTSGKGLLIRRVLGLGLMVFSALGLGISLIALVVVCSLSRRAAPSADNALVLTIAALDSTAQNLDLAHSALGQAHDSLIVAQALVDDADDGLQNSGNAIGSLSDTLSRDLPKVIRESRRSLAAAEEGAAVIEELLYGLNAISALTGVTYDPDVSLEESFGRMNRSLEALPPTLHELDESLSAVQQNLTDMQTSLADVKDPLSESQALLEEAQGSVMEYSDTIADLAFRLSNLREVLPSWIRLSIFALYFLLIWLAISQVGLLWQGWEMVTYHPGAVESRLRALEQRVEELARQAGA